MTMTMSMLLFFILVSVPLCASFDPSLSLAGQHFNITMIHAEGFVDMGYIDADVDLLPSSEWRGFLVDMIEWISGKAGFTYTLSSPSGTGRSCIHKENGEEDPMFSSRYSVQYKCGSDDVDMNMTDMYWSLYYVTPSRLSSHLMTTPFISDVGVTLTADVTNPGSDFDVIMDHMQLLFKPFTPYMWLTTAITILLTSLTMWIIEHSTFNRGDRFVTKNPRDLTVRAQLEILEEKQFDVRPRDAQGYFTLTSFTSKIGDIIEKVFLSLTTHDLFQPQSSRGRVINSLFCFFCLIWMASYTANLAAGLGKSVNSVKFATIDDLAILQKTQNFKPVCAKANTAYADWLSKAFEDLDIITGPASYELLYEDLKDGKCSAIVDALPFAIYNTNSPDRCDSGAAIIGSPLSFGNIDMAVGVREDLPLVRNVLSYWIQELRNCKSSMRGGACYNEMNMDDLFKKWAETGKCSNQQEKDQHSLPVITFVPILSILGFICIFSVIWELVSDKKARKVVERHFGCGVEANSFSIVDYIKTQFPQTYDANDEFKYDVWQEIWESQRDTSGFIQDIARILSHHYLATDIITWRLLRQTRKRLENQLFVLTEVHMDPKNASKNASRIQFTQSLILNCYDIFEMLTSRAIEEITDQEDHEAVTKLRLRKASELLQKDGRKGAGMPFKSKDAAVKERMRRTNKMIQRDEILNLSNRNEEKPMYQRRPVETLNVTNDESAQAVLGDSHDSERIGNARSPRAAAASQRLKTSRRRQSAIQLTVQKEAMRRSSSMGDQNPDLLSDIEAVRSQQETQEQGGEKKDKNIFASWFNIG